MTHTPGPWKNVMAFGNSRRIHVGGFEPIAIVGRPDKKRTLHTACTDEVEANARLIAAAPELLQTCEAVLEFLKAWEENIPTGAIQDLVERVILKATKPTE